MNDFEKIYIFFFILLVGVFGYFLYVQTQKQSFDGVRVDMLQIGQGDATLITFDDGRQMLVDCAKDTGVLEALGKHMSFFDKTIDYLVITHPDYDHYGGCIDVLKTYTFHEIIYTGMQKKGRFFKEFIQAIDHEVQGGARYTQIDKAQIWNIGDAEISFLYPNKPLDILKQEVKNSHKSNNTSIVFMVSYGEIDILFTGDAEEEIEQYLIELYGSQLDVELLKLGHHGSKSSSIKPFIEQTTPEASFVSAGKDNSYGHPAYDVVQRVKKAGSSIYETAVHGTISIYMSTSSYHIITEY